MMIGDSEERLARIERAAGPKEGFNIADGLGPQEYVTAD
jgi:hypothetical protein